MKTETLPLIIDKACPTPQWCELDATGCLDFCKEAGSLAMSGAGNCPDLKACMKDACIGACTDTPDPDAA